MTRYRRPRLAGASLLVFTLAAPLVLSPIFTAPAHALFGFGRIVYDPTNHAENLQTAARTLEQINNQITSLQNEAQMLINQAKNLASLPYSSLQQLQQSVQRTQQLVGESQGATGALQATQAGNQLLALQSQQLSDLIAVISANGRADALSEAERATAAEQGRIQRERFLTPGSGYQPGDASMFNN